MTYRPSATEMREYHRLLEQKFQQLSPELKTPHQVLGRRSTIGCVAVEVTQRCNLDCTLCYLSEYSESIPDVPLATIKRRLDLVKEQYGVTTNVQITGGDPTLRDRRELVEIVRYASSIGLYPALFTNGIRASREMMKELAGAGLVDVAFHVDMTQERKGFENEMELCAVREKYLERAHGLGVAIIFNTTLFGGNVHEVPALTRWFRDRAGTIGMASFQMQAATGRGVLRARDHRTLTKLYVRELIEEGLGTQLSWETVLHGHPDCHNIAYTLSTEGLTVDFFDDPELNADFLHDFGPVEMDRTRPVESVLKLMKYALAEKPGWYLRSAKWLGRKALAFGPSLIKAKLERRHAGKISFFIQNFQDDDDLDPARIHNCSFHVITDRGGISMCEHNARRDEFIVPSWMKKGVDLLPSRPPISNESDRSRPSSSG
jgi:7,8-dihydro-6-hydroxymethylpterin dimethyltransferase